MRWGLYGEHSRELLTYHGRVIVHPDRAELEYLFPRARVREVPPTFRADQVTPLAQHPDMSCVRFPLRRSDFR